MKTIKVTATTNSLASNTAAFLDAIGVTCAAKHNGGKVVILTCAESEIPAIAAKLDAAYQVSAYEVRS